MRSLRLYTTKKCSKDLVGFVFCIVLALPTLLFAQRVTVPFTFRNGEVADADQVNKNFTELQNAVNSNQAVAWEPGTVSGDLVYNRGNVGIGVPNPTADLEVNGTISSTGANGRMQSSVFAGNTSITTIVTPADLEIVMEPVDNPSIFSFLDVFKTGGSPIFSLGETGNLILTGTARAQQFITTSDARLKTNILQLTGVLEKLAKVRGVSFEWNELYKSRSDSEHHREIGVIAQEVEAVFPELVTSHGDERYKGIDSYKAVDYGRMTAILIEAIKELKTENDAQQQQIASLEARLVALEQAGRERNVLTYISSSALFPSWLLFGGLLMGGIVLRRYWQARG